MTSKLSLEGVRLVNGSLFCSLNTALPLAGGLELQEDCPSANPESDTVIKTATKMIFVILAIIKNVIDYECKFIDNR